MTVSKRSPTFLSRSRPSSNCFLTARSSSLQRRASASASSRPSTARFRAASWDLRSRLLPWAARLLKALILSLTELSRLWPGAAGDMRLWMETLEVRVEGEPICLLMRSEETGSRGAIRAAVADCAASSAVGVLFWGATDVRDGVEGASSRGVAGGSMVLCFFVP